MVKSHRVIAEHGGHGVLDVDDGGADVDEDVAEVADVPPFVQRSAVTILSGEIIQYDKICQSLLKILPN